MATLNFQNSPVFSMKTAFWLHVYVMKQ